MPKTNASSAGQGVLDARYVKKSGDTMTGALTVTNLTDSAMTLGSLLFAGTSGILAQDNSGIFYDATNHRLGLGTATPSEILHIKKTTGNFTTIRFDSGNTQGYFFSYDGDNSVNIGANSSSALNLKANNATVLAIAVGGNITPVDGANLILGTTTGMQIGTGTTQKLSFYGVTPIVQRASANQVAAPAGGTGATAGAYDTAAHRDALINLVNEMRTVLVNLGLMKGAA